MSVWNLTAPLPAVVLSGAMGMVGDVQSVNPLTTATLGGPTSGLTGTAQVYTITLNIPANQTYIITPTCPGAAISPGTLNITAGNSVGTFTVTPPTDGTYSVDFTVSPSLTRAGRPISLVATSVTWSASVPTQLFNQGTAASHDMVQYTQNFDPLIHQFQLLAGSLPSGVSVVPSSGLSWSGVGSVGDTSGIRLTIVDSGGQDWVSRSSGSLLADRLGTSVKLVPGAIDATHWVLNDGAQNHITFDQTVSPPGSTGSWKQAVLNTDGSGSGSIGIYFGNVTNFGQGSTFWISFRKLAAPQTAYQPYLANDGTVTWSKLSIIAYSLGTSVPNEIVTVTPHGGNEIGGYHQDGTSFPPEDASWTSVAQANDFNTQPLVDRGANPLTGVNPDTGAVWSTWEQQRAQWGLLYSAYSSPRAENFREGYGDPWSGGWREKPNQWNTYVMRVVVGTWGSFSSRITLWAANEGLAPDKIYDNQNEKLGTNNNYDTLWLFHYVTNRVAGGRQVGSRTNNISGTTIHTVGNATPLGAGTLEYNATTQRFRYQAAGESFGVTRGFSATNNRLIFNATSSVAGSYLVVEVNPAQLPTSGTVADTVTISNGRPDSAVWYADPIISLNRINFPGGFVPVG